MRPDLTPLGKELDAIARLGVMQGHGDPVARMAEHAEASMAQAWEQALRRAMDGGSSRPQNLPNTGESPIRQLGAQGPVRAPNPSQSSPPFATSLNPSSAAERMQLDAHPPGQMALMPFAWGAQNMGQGAMLPGALVNPGLGLSPVAYGGMAEGQIALAGAYGTLPPALANAWGMRPPIQAQGFGAVKATGLNPELVSLIEEKAAKHGVPAWLVKQVVMAESGGNPKAVSPVGAQGLMQLMPETARELGVDNPLNPADNVDGGVRYLRRMLDAFGGDLPKAVAAYNAGPGAVARHGGVPPYAETQAYVRRVLGTSG